MKEMQWEKVYTGYDLMEADMIRAELESRSIELKMISNRVSPYPINIGHMGEIVIYVKPDDLDDAAEVVRELLAEGMQ